MSIINESVIKTFINKRNKEYEGKLVLSYGLHKDCGVIKLALSKGDRLIREIPRKLNMRRTQSTETIQENNIIGLTLIDILDNHAKDILHE